MPSVATTNLYRVRSTQVVRPECGPIKTIEPGTILWMHGSRKSSLGGYIGTFSNTYTQANGYSPTGNTFQLSKDHVEEVY